jgi:hypothetical protein
MDVVIDDGYASADGNVRYGLTNLAQTCAAAHEREWARLIADHFDRMERSTARTEALHELMKDWAAVRDRLVLRMWETVDVEGMVQSGGEFVSEERAPGLSAVLMVDDEEVTVNVQGEHAAAWGVPTGELIEIAMENVARLEGEAGTEPVMLGEESEVPVMLYDGGGVWSAAMALRLESLPGMSGAQGAMVSVPTRSMFFSVPINGPEFVGRIGPLIGVTQQAANDGPGEVSRRLWWVREGRWVELPYSVKGGKIEFMPPDEFNRMVEGLVDTGA